MDVVADAGAVLSVVVGAEYGNLLFWGDDAAED